MPTYYLSYSAGNDTTGNGSYANPWKTSSKANASSVTGDTIVYKNGTHTITANMLWTHLVHLEAETDGLAILDWVGAAYYWTNDNQVTPNGYASTAEGLVFYRVASGGTGHIISLYGWTLTNCEFRECRIGNSSDNLGYYGLIGGYRSSDSTLDITLNNCLFNDCRAYQVSTNTISNFFSWRGDAGTTGTSKVYLNKCTFYIKTLETGITQTRLFNQYVSTGTGVVAKNCVIYDATNTFNLNFLSSSTTSSFTYSTAYNFGTPPSGFTGVITTDPLFIAKTSNIFRLRSNGDDVISPAIDAGDPT